MCLSPDAKFLRIEKFGRVDVVEVGVIHGIAFSRTSFTPIGVVARPVFGLLPVPECAYHNVLYDTQVTDGVKGQLAEKRGVVKTELSTGSAGRAAHSVVSFLAVIRVAHRLKSVIF